MLLFRCLVILSLGALATASFHHNPIFARVFGSDAPLAQKFFGHDYNNYHQPVNTWWVEPQETDYEEEEEDFEPQNFVYQNFEPQSFVYEDEDDDDEPYPEPQPIIIEQQPEPIVITTPKKEYNFNALPHFDIQNRFRTETVFKPQNVFKPQPEPQKITSTKTNADGEHIFNLLPHYDRKHVFRNRFLIPRF